MTTITIKDLRMNRELDSKAMSRIKGADGALWVFSCAKPYVEAARRLGSVINFYQTNYVYIADQMNNQISMIDVDNSGANSTINIDLDQQAKNHKLSPA
jgi:hypothetical protein